MGEYFRDREDSLIVYDDLSNKLCVSLISLLLRRPPGPRSVSRRRVLSHSRLLERAARVNEDYVEKFTKG